jgi:hypothetical protein
VCVCVCVYVCVQCTDDVTLKRVHESLLPWKSNKYYFLVCVCVRALGSRVRGRVHARTMHVALLIQHETRMRHIVTSFVAPTSPQKFFDIIS